MGGDWKKGIFCCVFFFFSFFLTSLSFSFSSFPRFLHTLRETGGAWNATKEGSIFTHRLSVYEHSDNNGVGPFSFFFFFLIPWSSARSFACFERKELATLGGR